MQFTNEQWTFIQECVMECMKNIGLHQNEYYHNPKTDPDYVIKYFKEHDTCGGCFTDSRNGTSQIFYYFDNVRITICLKDHGAEYIDEKSIWKYISFLMGSMRRYEWLYQNIPDITSWDNDMKDKESHKAGMKFANTICKQKFGIEVY